MTKAEIVERVFEKGTHSKRDCAELVENVFDILKTTLEAGEEVKISGFGKFEVKSKDERLGRNPITGESLTIAARKVMSFKPSSVLKQSINSIPE